MSQEAEADPVAVQALAMSDEQRVFRIPMEVKLNGVQLEGIFVVGSVLGNEDPPEAVASWLIGLGLWSFMLLLETDPPLVAALDRDGSLSEFVDRHSDPVRTAFGGQVVLPNTLAEMFRPVARDRA